MDRSLKAIGKKKLSDQGYMSEFELFVAAMIFIGNSVSINVLFQQVSFACSIPSLMNIAGREYQLSPTVINPDVKIRNIITYGKKHRVNIVCIARCKGIGYPQGSGRTYLNRLCNFIRTAKLGGYNLLYVVIPGIIK